MSDYNLTTPDDSKMSRINSGGLINARLNNLWNMAYRNSLNGKYSTWNAVLDCIWTELGGEYKSDSNEQKSFEKINEKLKMVKNWGSLKVGFSRDDSKDKLEMTRQYKELRDKELFLKRTQNKQGKGTAYNDDDEFSL